MTTNTQKRIGFIQERIAKDHDCISKGIVLDDLAWCVEQLLKTLPKLRKRKGKKIPGMKKVRAPLEITGGDINDARSNSCVDYEAWGDNMVGALERPDIGVGEDVAGEAPKSIEKYASRNEPMTLHARVEFALDMIAGPSVEAIEYSDRRAACLAYQSGNQREACAA